jgi:hypothetical protein
MPNFLVIIILVGLVWLAWDYLRSRRKSFEDRYMALYGRRNWDACNMELRLSFDRDKDRDVKELFQQRLNQHLLQINPNGSLLHEIPRLHRRGIDFYYNACTTLQDLMFPRRGIYLDGGQPGQLNIVWNHIQSDGIRLWRTLRPLFDTNSAILDFCPPKMPPAFLPELLALPTTIRRIFFRYNLAPAEAGKLFHGFKIWQTQPIKRLKAQKKIASFNVVTAALILHELFHMHRDVGQFTVGLTVAFTFLDAKNQYGVITLKIKRADFDGICAQIMAQVKSPARIWGTFSTQSYVLSFLPDRLFKRIMNYFRGQLDVLISSLPLGRDTAEINGVPITLSCYPKELTIPYYFLLMGAGPQIHMSFTHKFHMPSDFMSQKRVIAAT